jgi:hypothetical protein
MGAARAEPMGVRVLPYPSLIGQAGILQPSIDLGRPGISLETRASNGLVPPRLAISGAFPLANRLRIRESGWAWGFRLGATAYVWHPEEEFAAGQYFWELAFGRGTTEPLLEGASGLRGFMEFSLRNDRPKASKTIGEVTNGISGPLRDGKLFLGVKIGAGSINDMPGLVTQKPGAWSTRLVSQAYFPLQDAGSASLSFQSTVLRTCGLPELGCGLHLSYDKTFGTHKYTAKSDYEEISDLLGGGPSLAFTWEDLWGIALDATWYGYLNKNVSGGEGVPSLSLRLQGAFL